MENKENESEFKEEIIILDKPVVLRNQPKRLNAKIAKIKGKRTLLGKVGQVPVPIEIPKPKKSNAEFLIDTIVKTYWTTKWKEQLVIMKYSRTGFNRKRGDFRGLCMKLNHSMKYHQYLYLAKLFDNMEKLPVKQGVKHDDFYGKIKLISNNKNTEKVKEEKNNNGNEKFMIDDVKFEIKMDIPKLDEVEYKPEDEIKIENKNDNDNNNDNVISGDKIEIQPEPVKPKLMLHNKINKIRKKGKTILNNIENKDRTNNVEEKNMNINIEEPKINISEEKNIINIEKPNIINNNEDNNMNINIEEPKINIVEEKNIINIEKPNIISNNEDNNMNINIEEPKINIVEEKKIINNMDQTNIINNKEEKNDINNKLEDKNIINVEEKNIINIEEPNIINNKDDQNIDINKEEVKKLYNKISKKYSFLNNMNDAINNIISTEKRKSLNKNKENINKIEVKEEIIIDPIKIEEKKENKENDKKEKPKITINTTNEDIKEKKDNNLSKKKLKRIDDNYVQIESFGRKRRSANLIVRTEKGIEIQEDEENSGLKKRKMSDFINDYGTDRIYKSKRLQYKLKKIKDKEV